MAVMVSASGVMTTRPAVAGAVTVTLSVPVAGPDAAVITAVPTASACTSPDAFTCAIVGFEDDQDTGAPAITVPLASFTTAAACRVLPVVSPAEAGVTDTVLATGPVAAVTVTVASSLS